MALIIAVLVLCWTPAMVFANFIDINAADGSQLVELGRDLTMLLVRVNSCLNPLLYSWRVKAFRKAYRRMRGLYGGYA